MDSLTLGLTPTVEEIEKWFLKHEFAKEVIGKSSQQRDLTVYRRLLFNKKDVNKKNKEVISVFFYSLVHGNEILGLLTLLETADEIINNHAFLRDLHQTSEFKKEAYELQLIFFPVVNVDAYTINVEAYNEFKVKNTTEIDNNPRATWCWRTNFAESAGCPLNNATCVGGGVDLNRNFPVHWGESSDTEDCINYPGIKPFSEPESRAIRDVVLKAKENNKPVKASITYHMRSSSSESLLIQPYSYVKSHVPVMNEKDVLQFNLWAAEISKGNSYKTGRAFDVIYDASGSSIDWLYENQTILAYTFEQGTPCGQRWCGEQHTNDVAKVVKQNTQAGTALVGKLASGDKLELLGNKPNLDNNITSTKDNTSENTPSKSEHKWNVIFGVMGVALIVMVVGGLVVYWLKRRKRIGRINNLDVDEIDRLTDTELVDDLDDYFDDEDSSPFV